MQGKRLEARSGAYAVSLLTAVGILALFEWRTDEDLVTLAVLVGASFVLGLLNPRLFWMSAIVVGLVVPALGLFTLVTGIRPIYETASQAGTHGAKYVLSLLVLVLPALLFAWLGSLAGKRLLRARGGGAAATSAG